MLFITGDCHGNFNRFSNTNWNGVKLLTRNDFVIIAGDCGLLFYPEATKEELWWLQWLQDRPFTLLMVDGNHDNHFKLQNLPTEEKFGGIVGKVAENIYHLRRGEVYEICGKKILTFGGATSIDKVYRIEEVSWWPQEVPNYADMDHCISSMEKHNDCVDFIIAHTCPQFLVPVIAGKIGGKALDDPTGKMLDHIISRCKHSHFFCGHWHMDVDYGSYHFLYNRVLNISDWV